MANVETSLSDEGIYSLEHARLLPEWASIHVEGIWHEPSRTYNSIEVLDSGLEGRAIEVMSAPLFLGYNNSYANYYHLLLEWIPTVWQFSRSNLPRGTELGLPRNHSDWPALWELIVGLDLDKRTRWIENSCDGKVIESPCIFYSDYLSSSRNYDYGEPARSAHRWLGARFANRSGLIEAPRRIHIARTDSSKRTLVNRRELAQELESRWGFVTLELSKLSMATQVSLFQQAEIVVADHGAGLANLVFDGVQERRVVEIRSSTYPNLCFEAISIALGQRHVVVPSELTGGETWSQLSESQVSIESVNDALAALD